MIPSLPQQQATRFLLADTPGTLLQALTQWSHHGWRRRRGKVRRRDTFKQGVALAVILGMLSNQAGAVRLALPTDDPAQVASLTVTVSADPTAIGASPGDVSVSPGATPLALPTYDPAKVANPMATVSAGPTAIGASPGSFAVSPSGTATYTIPLQVPLGRAGFQPNLAIEYSSTSGDGLLGMGFSLSGPSLITRCAKTIADDGVALGVQLDATDRFCLGGRKLVAVSGVYGADGTEYRTLPDTQVRVKSYRASTIAVGPTHFEVHLPDGQTQYYGRDSLSRVDVVSVKPQATTINVAWPLLAAIDGAKNRINYYYGNRLVNDVEVERYLEQVIYGSPGSLDRQVSFAYEDRPDKTYGWQYGSPRQGTRRLKTVTMLVNAGGWKQVRQYKLDYLSVNNSGATGRSKLWKITACGMTSSECLRPTEFTWTHGGTGFQAGVTQSMALPSSANAMILAADFNGDGRTDIAYPEATKWKYVLSQPAPSNGKHYGLAQDAGNNPWGVGATAYPIDYNLDGKTDLLPISPQTSQWRPLLSKGNGGWVQLSTEFWGPLNQVGNGTAAYFGDFNGDGYQDVLEGRFYPDQNKWRWWMRLRTGKVSASIDHATNPVDTEAFIRDADVPEISNSVPAAPNRVLVLDVNGDGRDEIVWSNVDHLPPHAYDPVAHVQTPLTGLRGDMFNLDIKLADLNGDGLVDLVTNGASVPSPNGALYYWLNTGRGFAAPVPMSGITVGKNALQAAQVVDVNADGRFELLLPRLTSNPTFEPVYIGMDLVQDSFNAAGELVFTRSTTPAINYPSGLTNDDLKKQGIRIVDADGDGLSDVVVFDRPGHATSSAVTLFKSYPVKGDRLTEIRDGNRIPVQPVGEPSSAQVAAPPTPPPPGPLPPTVRITYTPLTDLSVYTPGACGRIVGMSCAEGTPMLVVKKVERDSGKRYCLNCGPPATTVSEYRYSSGRFDKKTGGFAGFAEVLVSTYGLQTGVQSGHVTMRSFYTNTGAGKAPRLEEQWTYAVNVPGQHAQHTPYALERKSVVWQTRQLGATYFDFTSATLSRSYELTQDNSCHMHSECLDEITRSGFDALGYSPYRTVSTAHLAVDDFGNVTQAQTQYGSGVERTDITTIYDIDIANWLLRRPKKVVTVDKTHNGQANLTGTRTVEYTYHSDIFRPHLVKQLKSYGAAPTSGTVLSVDYEYYSDGQPARTTATDVSSGKQRETMYAYDPHGFPHAVQNALGHTSYTGYDPLTGQMQITVDPNGLRTDYTHDSLGRLVKTTLPGGVKHTIAYSLQTHGQEQLVQVERSDATGSKTQRLLDRGGRPLVERSRGFDGVMRERTLQYDALGRLVASTVARRAGSAESVETITSAYDDLGRLIKQTEPGNAIRTFNYDKLTVTRTDTRGHKTQTAMNERGLKVAETDALVTAEETTRLYGYAPFSKMAQTQVSGVANSLSSFDYDETGRLRASADPERGSKSYEHNAFGELTRRAEGDAETTRETTLAYDILGRLRTKTVKENSTLRSRTEHTYDTVGVERTTLGALLRSTFTVYGAGGYIHTADFRFDELGRPSGTDYTMQSDVTPSANETMEVRYLYDSLNRLSTVVYPRLLGQTHSTQVLYEYAPPATSNGRLQRIRALEVGTSVHTVWEAEATDQQDRLSQCKVGNGVHTLHGFDWRGLTTSTVVSTDGQDEEGEKMLARLRFGYDTEGNLTSRTDELQPATETFAYDPLNRLLAASTKSADPLLQPDDRFTYDKLGNLTSSLRRGTYTFNTNKPMQMVAVTAGPLGGGRRTYGYDVFGNQVSRPEGKVVYNDFNLPARYTTHSGDTTATFRYDAAGQRARKVSAAGTVTYVPGLYERHRRTDGTVEHRLLVTGAGATLRYLEQSGSLTRQPTLYTHGDHLGSTSLLTQQDESVTGFKAVVAEKRSYESFGLPRNPDWKSPDVFGGIQPALLDEGYTGHDEDREMALINMKGRIYDPKLGRFLSADPHVDGANPTQRWNRYAYVSNNPLRFTDPTGFRYNLEAIKQRVESNATQFNWVGGDLGGYGGSFMNQVYGGYGASCANLACGPTASGDAYGVLRIHARQAMRAGLDFATQMCDGNRGCTDSQYNAYVLGYAKAWMKGREDVYAKNAQHKRDHTGPYQAPYAREAKPSTDGSIGGNASSQGLCSNGALCLEDSGASKDPKETVAAGDAGQPQGDARAKGATDPLGPTQPAPASPTAPTAFPEYPGDLQNPKMPPPRMPTNIPEYGIPPASPPSSPPSSPPPGWLPVIAGPVFVAAMAFLATIFYSRTSIVSEDEEQRMIEESRRK